ncbi:MAG TPA: hypothetical protein VGL91_11020 [Acidobacteriota bacterium]
MVGGTIAGVGSLIVRWLGERKKRFELVTKGLVALVQELEGNRDLPRQARMQIRTDALNRAIAGDWISDGLRSALNQVDRYGRVLLSFSDCGLPTQTVDPVFKDSFLPGLEKALALARQEQKEWQRRKWWRRPRVKP